MGGDGVLAIGALKILLEAAARFFRGAERFEAGWWVPLFFEGFGASEVAAEDGAQVVEGGAGVGEDSTGSAVGSTMHSTPASAAKRLAEGGAGESPGEPSMATRLRAEEHCSGRVRHELQECS